MTKLKKILCAAATLSVGALAAPADGATIIEAISGGPFSATSSPGGLPVMALNKADTYDFTFTIVPPAALNTVTQIEAQSRSKGVGVDDLIQFDLYSGTPTGSNSYIATSAAATASILTAYLAPGQYFVQINPTYIAVNGEVDSGSLTTLSVPEPASWALMMLGVGAIGAALRGRRRLAAA